jgi:hypothetical protein
MQSLSLFIKPATVFTVFSQHLLRRICFKLYFFDVNIFYVICIDWNPILEKIDKFRFKFYVKWDLCWLDIYCCYICIVAKLITLHKIRKYFSVYFAKY